MSAVRVVTGHANFTAINAGAAVTVLDATPPPDFCLVLTGQAMGPNVVTGMLAFRVTLPDRVLHFAADTLHYKPPIVGAPGQRMLVEITNVGASNLGSVNTTVSVYGFLVPRAEFAASPDPVTLGDGLDPARW